jgi:hypothetical protein
MQNIQNIVVTSQNTESCGAIVMWTLTGEVRVAPLNSALVAAGAADEELLVAASPAAALARAAKAQATRNIGGVRRLVRPIRDGLLAVVEERVTSGETAHSEDLELKTVAIAGVDADGLLDQLRGDPGVCAAIEAQYNAERDSISHTELSGWITQLVERSGGVPLRGRGGVYFVPRTQISHFESLAKALESVSESRVYAIQALQSDEAVEAILDSVARDTEAELAGVADDLEAGTMTPLKAKRRETVIARLEARLSEYEALLGRRHAGCRDHLETLQGCLANLVMAS